MAYDGGSISGCSPTLAVVNGIGRRTAMCDGAGWESWAYDTRGHVTTDRRKTNTVMKDIIYAYNYVGAETSVTYPSGRTLTYTYNAAAQVTSASDIGNGITYASNAHYAPAGALAFLQNGATIKSTYIFDSRLQPCWMSSTSGTPAITWNGTQCNDVASAGNILDYKYNFGLGSQDNGNVLSISNNITPGRSQNFTYDELNRISSAVTLATSGQYCWGQDFTYDAWANLKTVAGDPSRPSCGMNGLSVGPYVNNRLTDAPYAYDAAGNMTHDATNSYTFAAENQIVSTAGITYTYDGDGNRVQKSTGKLYWLGTGRDPFDETDSSGNLTDEYIFFGGKRIARRDSSSNVVYYFSDHLGTTHVVTDSAGTIQDDSDFYPFGGERAYTSVSGNNYKFSGKQRDSESGLDYFGARYYSSGMGRFASPDGPTTDEDPANPASWNRYAYTNNRPLFLTDPTGHIKKDKDGNVIFEKTGHDTEEYAKGTNSAGETITITWEKDTGYVYADDGTKIPAVKPTSEMKVTVTDAAGNSEPEKADKLKKEMTDAGFSNSSNCNGTTFAKGQVWIYNNQVADVLKHDNYTQTTKPQVGDVGVYSKDRIPQHTTTVTGVDSDTGAVKQVESKAGIEAKKTTAPGPGEGTAWKDDQSKLMYYHKKD